MFVLFPVSVSVIKGNVGLLDVIHISWKRNKTTLRCFRYLGVTSKDILGMSLCACYFIELIRDWNFVIVLLHAVACSTLFLLDILNNFRSWACFTFHE